MDRLNVLCQRLDKPVLHQDGKVHAGVSMFMSLVFIACLVFFVATNLQQFLTSLPCSLFL